MLDDYDLRGAMQHAGAAIVAEATPQGEHGGLVGRGEHGDSGETFHPARVVVENSSDARLLQHDLRDPNGVGVAGSPPRQIALVLREPFEEHRGNGGRVGEEIVRKHGDYFTERGSGQQNVLPVHMPRIATV
jgi:hypothetical protein